MDIYYNTQNCVYFVHQVFKFFNIVLKLYTKKCVSSKLYAMGQIWSIKFIMQVVELFRLEITIFMHS